jgi:hypothetical protein
VYQDDVADLGHERYQLIDFVAPFKNNHSYFQKKKLLMANRSARSETARRQSGAAPNGITTVESSTALIIVNTMIEKYRCMD